MERHIFSILESDLLFLFDSFVFPWNNHFENKSADVFGGSLGFIAISKRIRIDSALFGRFLGSPASYGAVVGTPIETVHLKLLKSDLFS
jgi:hypothetical protein